MPIGPRRKHKPRGRNDVSHARLRRRCADRQRKAPLVWERGGASGLRHGEASGDAGLSRQRFAA